MSRELTKEQDFRQEFEQLRKEYPEVERHIKVADNWYPNFPDGTVLGRISILLNTEYSMNREPRNPKYIAHICFWGYDDLGMEKWFYNNDLNKVVDMYEEFKEYLNKIPENINLKDYLEKDDFRHA